MPWPPVTPVFPAGMEPLPPGMTEDDRKQLLEAKKYQDYMAMGMESCIAKVVMAGGAGALRMITLRSSRLLTSRKEWHLVDFLR